MATAINKASIDRDIPETKSPAIVSLIAFVMAIPGTSSIIDPIIIVSMLPTRPNEAAMRAMNAAKEPQSMFFRKLLTSNLSRDALK